MASNDVYAMGDTILLEKPWAFTVSREFLKTYCAECLVKLVIIFY